MAEVSKEPTPVARWVKGRNELVKGVSPATAPPGKKSGSQYTPFISKGKEKAAK